MKAKHLTLEDRKAIQEGIEKRLSKTAIAKSISKEPTTVAKEIKLHRTVKQRNRSNSPVVCTKLKLCKKPRKLCSESCSDYVEQPCTMRDRSIGACNHCERISRVNSTITSTMPITLMKLICFISQFQGRELIFQKPNTPSLPNYN